MVSESYFTLHVTFNKFKWCTVHLLKSFFFLQSEDPLQSFHNNWVHVLLIPNSSKLLFTNVPKTQKRKNRTEILLQLLVVFFLNRSSLCCYCNNLLKQCKALKTRVSYCVCNKSMSIISDICHNFEYTIYMRHLIKFKRLF
jgi:hypothetical protein